ncbi:MAG: Nramp family divalent metal transporter [Aeoliella sp.]
MTATTKNRPWWKQFGPGLLVTAAFIGPGTVTTASRAGAEFGYALLWTLVFAIAATAILQEMAARLGLVARQDLATAIRGSISPAPLRWLALALVLMAIAVGNAAYQTGNLTGAALGLSLLVDWSQTTCVLAIGFAVMGLLLLGATKGRLQTLLIGLVLLMSIAFLATAVVVRPNVNSTLQGVYSFELPAGSLLTVVALIGTTVVPYNLFLHATTVQQKWPQDIDAHKALRAARWDTLLSISLGGLVTMSIIVTAATVFVQRQPLEAASEMAAQLEPLLGSAAKNLFALGMLAAGLTSAITAPLAAGYVAAGSFQWQRYSTSQVTTFVALAVALTGTILALCFGSSPQVTIVVAQAANGLLLPMIAMFLLFVMNQASLLGEHRNGPAANSLGIAVVIVTVGLGLRAIGKLL